MQGKLAWAAGFAAGYVLGSKAGRQRYEEIVAQARRVAGNQTVQSTAGVLQAQASDLVSKAKQSDLVNKAKQSELVNKAVGKVKGGEDKSDTRTTASTYSEPPTTTTPTSTTPPPTTTDIFEPANSPRTTSGPTGPTGTNGSNP
jgi:hypothetical protein